MKRRKTAKTQSAKTKSAKTKTGKTKPVRAKPLGKPGTHTRTHRVPAKKQQDNFIETLIAAGAQALGLTIDPAWRDAVGFHLRLVLDHAARVDEFPLPDDAEPAPVFHA